MSPTVSVEAASRQSFGVMFNHSSKDTGLANRILDGKLELSPHPVWEFEGDIDWRADPFQDRNWRAQLHMLRWMDPLRRRAEKGDAAAAETWLRYAEDWVLKNPPGRRSAPEAWLNMVDGLRALELCLAVPFVSKHRPAALEWLGSAIRTHADWMVDERHLGHSNHALHQHQGLFVCGAVLEDTGLQDLAARRLEELFTSAYDEQGINAEGALMYHLANYNWWSMARRRLEAEGHAIPKSMKALDEVPIELAHATKPSGTFVSIGDTDGGSPARIDHPATRWVGTAGADGEPPEDLIRIYDAGYLFARSGWGDQERDFPDETFWSVTFGATDRVHGHVDGGAMTFSSMGHEWITDPGKFQYGESPMRDYCLSRSSHSLVDVIGREYRSGTVVSCTRRQIDEAVYDVTFVDTGFEGVRLTRRITYSVSGEYAVVIDSVDSESEIEAVQNWQCGHGTTAQQTRRGFELTGPHDRKGALLFTGTVPSLSFEFGSEDPIAGWVATGWKSREAAPVLRFTKTGRRFRFITLVAAGFRGATPTMETVRTSVKGRVRLRVDTGRVAEQIVIDPQGARVVAFDEEAEVSAETSTCPGAPQLNPRDRALRRKVFVETRRARRAAWDAGAAADRESLAASLEEILESYTIVDGVDLGLRSAISDLRSAAPVGLNRKIVHRDRPGLINWSGDPTFRPTITNAPMVSLYGTASSIPHIATDTLVTYTLGSLVLPALVCPAPGNTLTVMFQGAVDRARVNLPIFQRVRFQKELGAGPTVVFADPTLDLSTELRLGWYLGTEDVDVTQAIARATSKLAESLETTDIVLQGGSGGGFAALQIGAMLPGSHVVAANPQTDLRRYNAKAYRAAMVAAFGSKTAPEDPETLRRISVMNQITDRGSRMSVTLVMNQGDIYHERNHAAPLRAALAEQPHVDLVDVAVDLGPGHRGLDNDQYGEVMKDVYKRIGTELRPGIPAD